MKNKSWFVYIIENEKKHFYTGITTDLERRFGEHLKKKKGAKFFNTGMPVKIIFRKKFSNRSEASKYEFYVKSLTKDEKINLISLELNQHD